MWGLLFAGVGLAGVLVFVFFLRGGGGDGTGCDQPLAPLGESPITAAEFQAVDQGLAQVAAAARLEALPGAENSFFGPVHNFTHNVDPPLREKNPELAKRLCETVLKIEEEFSVGRRPFEIALLAEDIRLILQDAAQELGFPAPESRIMWPIAIVGLPVLHHPLGGSSNLDSVLFLALAVIGIAILAYLFRKR
ncbi:MAG: hypothetical protein ACE5IZ_10705 [Dehalococcoidia bacterium]